MRVLPASVIKHGHRSKSAETIQDVPREGSELRRVYDELLLHRGHVVKFPFLGKRTIPDLRDYYGMDIVSGGSWKGYMLVGEWFGRVYVDYTQCPSPEIASAA